MQVQGISSFLYHKKYIKKEKKYLGIQTLLQKESEV